MNELEFKQLLELTKENNIMLHQIVEYLSSGHDDTKDFVMNFVANILSNNFERNHNGRASF